MIWYRGDTQEGTAGRWYAADPHYAGFFGPRISTLELDAGNLLDLRAYGVGDEDTVVDIPGLPPYGEVEMYLYVERADVQDAARALGYRGIRVWQWHADYDTAPQDTLLPI